MEIHELEELVKPEPQSSVAFTGSQSYDALSWMTMFQ